LRSGEIPYRDVIEPILERIKRSMRLNVFLNAEGPPPQIIEGVISADDHDNIARLAYLRAPEREVVENPLQNVWNRD
jgi:hypothetical protein